MAEIELSSEHVPSDKNGKFTFQVEGNEGGKYHSRKVHVPSKESGITIGRGYDMKSKSQAKVKSDLTEAGVKKEDAEKLSKGAGKKGKIAEDFLRENNLESFEISKEAQKKLFKISYDFEKSEAKRLCTKPDVTKAYGECKWDKLPTELQSLITDLKFRGDYAPTERKKIQKAIADQDLKKLNELFSNRNIWKANLPADRFHKRKAKMNEIYQKYQKKDTSTK